MSFNWADEDEEDGGVNVPVLESLLDCDNSKDGMSAFFKKVGRVLHVLFCSASCAHTRSIANVCEQPGC